MALLVFLSAAPLSGSTWSFSAPCVDQRADLDLLREHDDRAYEKALQSGGLLRYFKGGPTSEAVSVVLPVGDEGAGHEAAGAAAHQSAADISVRMYESYVLDRYWLKKVVTAREERLIFEPIRAA